MNRSTKRLRRAARDQMQDHLSVGGRLHHGTFVHEVAPQLDAIGEIAVVADSKSAAFEFRKQRLYVAQDGLAGGRITHMAYGGCARQTINHLAASEGVADQAEAAF